MLELGFVLVEVDEVLQVFYPECLIKVKLVLPCDYLQLLLDNQVIMIRVHISDYQLSNIWIITLQQTQDIISNFILEEICYWIGVIENPSIVIVPAVPIVYLYEILICNTRPFDYFVYQLKLEWIDYIELRPLLLNINFRLLNPDMIPSKILNEIDKR